MRCFRSFSLCLALLVVTSLALGPVAASEGEPKHGDKKGHGVEAATHAKEAKEDEGDDISGLFGNKDNIVALPTLIVPVTLNGRIVDHLYMYLAAVTASASNANAVKERIAYVQDAMVLAAYRNVPTKTTRDGDPDAAALLGVLKDVVNKAVGKPVVTDITVGRVDTAPY